MEKIKNFEEIVNHLKATGYVYQGSEIYGGLQNSWDFGPLGVSLKNNIKQLWWNEFIKKQPNNVGIDSAILMNPNVWKSSGHLGGFADMMVDCKNCQSRFRADKLIEENTSITQLDGKSSEELDEIIKTNNIKCPKCNSNNFTNARAFNLMFKTFIGTLEDSKSSVYLRPETAQGIFVNFSNILRTTRKKLPLGIGQIGKSFRNEITPGNFIFRVREFEQMELEFFTHPGEDMKWYQYWVDYCYNFVLKLGIKKENLRIRQHSEDELSFYSKGTSDIEYAYPFTSWGELWGIANRTDYDLKQHQDGSKKSLEYLDPYTNEKFIPYCIEPSVGVERMFLMILCDGYEKEMVNDEERIVLKIHPSIAPIKAAILPLTKKLSDESLKIYHDLMQEFDVEFDESGAIGKRYRRQDMIGTPYCITFDFDSLQDGAVTVRERDTMQQVRIPISELKEYLKTKTKF